MLTLVFPASHDGRLKIALDHGCTGAVRSTPAFDALPVGDNVAAAVDPFTNAVAACKAEQQHDQQKNQLCHNQTISRGGRLRAPWRPLEPLSYAPQSYKGIGLTVAIALTAVVGTGAANAADKLKIDVTATLEGSYTVLGEDGMRGYELLVEERGNKACGKEIETIVGSTDASPDSAVRAALSSGPLRAFRAPRCFSCRPKCFVPKAAHREWESSIPGITSE